MRSVIIVLALWLVSAPAWAQPAPQPDRREKIKKRIRALRAYTLTEELSLDEQTAGKLFPILAKYDDELDKLLAARADLQRRLEGARDERDAKILDKLIDDAVANQRAIWDAEDKRLQQLRKILTAGQTVRVLVVLPAMERKVQNQLRRVAQPKKDRRRVDPFAAPGDDILELEKPDAPPPARPARACDPFSARGCE